LNIMKIHASPYESKVRYLGRAYKYDQFSHTRTRRAQGGNPRQCAATIRLQLSPQGQPLSRRLPALRTVTDRHAAVHIEGDYYVRADLDHECPPQLTAERGLRPRTGYGGGSQDAASNPGHPATSRRLRCAEL